MKVKKKGALVADCPHLISHKFNRRIKGRDFATYVVHIRDAYKDICITYV